MSRFVLAFVMAVTLAATVATDAYAKSKGHRAASATAVKGGKSKVVTKAPPTSPPPYGNPTNGSNFGASGPYIGLKYVGEK